MKISTFFAARFVLACACVAAPTFATSAHVATTALPGDSVYQLDVPLVDQDGRRLHLADRRGKPQLISMFYTSCQYVCPLIIDTLQKTEHALAAADRTRVEVTLVSFDPATDTPPALKKVADERHVLSPRWLLTRTEAPQVRKLAAVLGIQYRELQNHDFNHTSVLILLDADGRIVARTDKIGEVDPRFVAEIERAIAR